MSYNLKRREYFRKLSSDLSRFVIELSSIPNQSSIGK